MKVIDGGPACYVENDAGGPVIDASFSMCQSCTNSIRSENYSYILDLKMNIQY